MPCSGRPGGARAQPPETQALVEAPEQGAAPLWVAQLPQPALADVRRRSRPDEQRELAARGEEIIEGSSLPRLQDRAVHETEPKARSRHRHRSPGSEAP